MPLYEYECESCGATFEVIQKFSDEPVNNCRVCGGPVHKLLSAPAIQFKGSGWYVTDYAKKGVTDPGGKKKDAGDAVTSSSLDAAKDTAAKEAPKAPSDSSSSSSTKTSGDKA